MPKVWRMNNWLVGSPHPHPNAQPRHPPQSTPSWKFKKWFYLPEMNRQVLRGTLGTQRPRLRAKGPARNRLQGTTFIHSFIFSTIIYWGPVVPGTVRFSGNTVPESRGRNRSTLKWTSFKEAATFVGRNWRDIQILASECHVPMKGPRLLGKMVDSKIGAEKVQEKSAIVLESKEGLKEWWGHVERTEEPAWRGSH